MTAVKGYEDPEKDYDFTYLALGAGVQSSALLLMSDQGIKGVPKADVAIFADTQVEPDFVLENLKSLQEHCQNIPIKVVTAGNLIEDYIKGAVHGESRCASLPVYTWDGENKGILKRACTSEYKINPIRREVRKILGYKKGERMAGKVNVRAMMGISFDEVQRMKPSNISWCDLSYPLIDNRMRRNDCFDVLAQHGWDRPPKSACIICPFRSNKGWLYFKNSHPDIWEAAVAFDKKIRYQPILRSQAFLHSSCKPLDEVVLDNGQKEFEFIYDGIEQDCSGHCGM